MEREKLWQWLHPLHMTQQYLLASMAARLSSTGISHHHLPHIPWIRLRSQQQPSPWDRSTIPNLQLPATALSRRPTFLPSICMAEARAVWFSLHLGCHRSAVSLSVLNVSPLTQTVALLWGLDRTPASVPPPAESRSSPTNTPVFSLVPLSYRVSAGFCIFMSTSQVLLSAVSWCSACTSGSEAVFLMYL